MSSTQGQDTPREAVRDEERPQQEANAPQNAGPVPVKKKKKKIDPLIGRTIGGRYTITTRIGAGGMGVVYKAKQGAVDRDIAIKVLLVKSMDDEDEYETLVRRFHLEAKAASQLQHPNTITIYDFGQDDDGLLYIAMEYLEGIPLDQVLKKGAMSPQQVVRVVMQICHSLSEAHKKNIIHRDIKPDNIFLCTMGGDADFVKVLDFGVAKIRGPSKEKTLTKAGMIFGTPKYMSPEQARCMSLDPRSDIYSVGVMMYQMLMGTVPFDADDHVSILLMHCSEPAEPFSKRRADIQIMAELEAIVFKALMKDRDARYQSVDEMAAALDQLATKFQFVASTAMLPIVSGYNTSSNPAISAVPRTPPPTQANTLSPEGGSDGFSLLDTVGPDPSIDMASVDASMSLEPPEDPTSMAPATNGAPSGDYRWQQDAKLDLSGGTQRQTAVKPDKDNRQNIAVIGGGVALALVVLLILGFVLFGGGDKKPDGDNPKAPATKQDEPDDKPEEADPVPAGEEDAGVAEGAADAEAEGEDAAVAVEDEVAEEKQTPEKVTLKLDSRPGRAKIFVDGKDTGLLTPATLREDFHEANELEIVFKKRGYEDLTESIQLNGDNAIKPDLKRKPATARPVNNNRPPNKATDKGAGKSQLPDPGDIFKN